MLAAAVAIPHVVEDLDAGVGVETLGRLGAAALAALLVGLLGALGLLVALTRRRPVRTLVTVDLFWATAALVDHPQALVSASGFRDGLTSAAPVLLLVVFAVLSAGLLVRGALVSDRPSAAPGHMRPS